MTLIEQIYTDFLTFKSKKISVNLLNQCHQWFKKINLCQKQN
jgi:hypothetical protein